MTEQKRKLGIRERSCGVTSPPPDHYRQESSKRTQCRGVGKFGFPSRSWIETVVKAKQMVKPSKCYRSVGVLSASSHGNMPSNWSCSQQSPPQVVEIKRGTGVWVI